MRERGSTLILTLVVLAGLVALIATVASSQQMAIRAEINREERSRAARAAESGVQRAITTLATIASPSQSGQTSTTTGSGNSTVSTNLQDDWATLGTNGDVKFIVGSSSFRLQIVDGSSFVNINSATQAQLEALPFTTDEVSAILDYRSTGNTARPDGAKDDYYNNLQQPYNTKEAPFETLDELLQVKGITAKLLFQPRTDVQSNNPAPVDANGNQLPLSAVLTAVSYAPQINTQGNQKYNVNTAGAAATKIGRLRGFGISAALANVIANNANWTSIGQICGQNGATRNDLTAILDNLAVGTQAQLTGRININTASQSVLQTIPGITSAIAQSIVQQQSTGFTSLGQIATISGVDGNVLRQAADFLTANSQTFVIRVIGTAGSTSIPFEAIVNVVNGVPKIIQMQEQPFNDMIARWNWNADTNTETVLKENK
jgi:DNA uptake protein ComE-like DNA-binding protein